MAMTKTTAREARARAETKRKNNCLLIYYNVGTSRKQSGVFLMLREKTAV